MRSAPLLLSVILLACGGSEGRDGGTGDAGARDAERADTGSTDRGSTEDGAMATDSGTVADGGILADAGMNADGGVPAEVLGFSIRRPQLRTVPCEGMFCGPSGTTDAPDKDFVCTLDHGNYRGKYVYVQARPTRYGGFNGLQYMVDGAFLSDGTTATPADAIYDFGGNHANDNITLTLPTVVYRYSHSSYGFGFRKCQPMDCLQVHAPGGATPTEDGCTRDRTLPVVCVEVVDDGTVPELVDHFMRCPGDPT